MLHFLATHVLMLWVSVICLTVLIGISTRNTERIIASVLYAGLIRVIAAFWLITVWAAIIGSMISVFMRP